jgi:hypothetical protein
MQLSVAKVCNLEWNAINERAKLSKAERNQALKAGINNIYLCSTCITYELLSHAIERSNNIVSLFKELENIRIDA